MERLLAPSSSANGSTLNGFANGLKVIRAFGRPAPALTLSDAARQVGISRAAARRILLTLVEEGYVEADGRFFRLRPRVLELGYSFLSSLGLDDVAATTMKRLVESTLTSCNISMLDGEEIVYLYRVPAPAGPMPSYDVSIGSRLPAHLTAMGRVMIGALPIEQRDALLSTMALHRNTRFTITDSRELAAVIKADRLQGWSLVSHEHAEGLCSLALPLDVPGRAMAIGVGWMVTDQTPQERAKVILPVLRAAATELRLSWKIPPSR